MYHVKHVKMSDMLRYVHNIYDMFNKYLSLGGELSLTGTVGGLDRVSLQESIITR